MRLVVVGIAVAAVAAAGCSSSSGGTGPVGGGHSLTIVASSTTSGGSYGHGGNYYFSPTPDSVATGSTVTFQFPASVTHNVTFTAVANVPADIPNSGGAGAMVNVNRTFTTAGTFDYHCTIHNIGGTVVVH